MEAAYQPSAHDLSLSLSGTDTELDAAAAEGGVASAPGPGMCHMLIVEDDAFQAESISILCKQCGYNAEVASNGKEVAATRALKPRGDGSFTRRACPPPRRATVRPLSLRVCNLAARPAASSSLPPPGPPLRRWTSFARTPRSTWCCPTS